MRMYTSKELATIIGRVSDLPIVDRLLRDYSDALADELPAGPITKWDVMHPIDRAAADATPFRGGCSKCGTQLPTEGDFARHFVVDDRRYMNLGQCPTTYGPIDKQAVLSRRVYSLLDSGASTTDFPQRGLGS